MDVDVLLFDVGGTVFDWKTAISHINRLKPDFMIVCGDLTHCANNPEKWKDKAIMASHEKLKIENEVRTEQQRFQRP